jgi:carbon-monoxide dehydrogenase medium subunit/xanthine dehydrogenase FAD-binding subunit
MNMSVVLCPDSLGRASELRIVPGAIMPVAKRMANVEDMLLGKKPDSEMLNAAGKALAEEMVEVTGMRWSTEYKVPVVQNVFRRVMGKLLSLG